MPEKSVASKPKAVNDSIDNNCDSGLGMSDSSAVEIDTTITLVHSKSSACGSYSNDLVPKKEQQILEQLKTEYEITN